MHMCGCKIGVDSPTYGMTVDTPNELAKKKNTTFNSTPINMENSMIQNERIQMPPPRPQWFSPQVCYMNFFVHFPKNKKF